jgi:4-aminobutyrate aminotransferase
VTSERSSPLPGGRRRLPRVADELPGERAAALLRRDGAAVSQGGLRPYRFVIAEGRGCWATDVDGNEFLDFTSGIGVLATGHCHPRVVAAAERQLRSFIHISSAYHSYDVMVELAERIGAGAPMSAGARVFFANSGTEAIEGAVKLARWSTGRPYLLSFFGAFHGRTMGAVSLAGINPAQRHRIGPLLPGVYHVPYPDPERGVSAAMVVERMEELFATVLPPDELAAAIVEPVQGGAGLMSIPDPEFLPALRQLADRHGFLLIADEIYCGVGRTGKMWASEHWQAGIDVLCFAKSIASGFPLGGVVARQGLMEWPRGTHNSTFGGNPVCCAAALATLDLLDEGLIDHAARIGAQLLTGLRAICARHPGVTRVAGKGLMICFELAAPEQAEAVLERAWRRGLLLLAALRTGIRLAPPLIVTEDEAAVALEILDEALHGV